MKAIAAHDWHPGFGVARQPLNVTLETVSRAFSALDNLGIISVERREIKILSLDAWRNFES